MGAMDAAAPAGGVAVAAQKSGPRRLLDDHQSPLTDWGPPGHEALDVWEANGGRLAHPCLQCDAPCVWLRRRPPLGGRAAPRGRPDRTAQSTTTPRAVPP